MRRSRPSRYAPPARAFQITAGRQLPVVQDCPGSTSSRSVVQKLARHLCRQWRELPPTGEERSELGIEFRELGQVALVSEVP